jgi:hypothetical protein
MPIRTIVLIILVVLLIAALPSWPYSSILRAVSVSCLLSSWYLCFWGGFKWQGPPEERHREALPKTLSQRCASALCSQSRDCRDPAMGDGDC